jgi:hypothetical protein
MAYQIAWAPSFDALIVEVERFEREGFIPQGGIAFGYATALHLLSVPVGIQENVMIFAQAMWKDGKK